MKLNHYLAMLACIGAAITAGNAGATWSVTLSIAAMVLILLTREPSDKEDKN